MVSSFCITQHDIIMFLYVFAGMVWGTGELCKYALEIKRDKERRSQTRPLFSDSVVLSRLKVLLK